MLYESINPSSDSHLDIRGALTGVESDPCGWYKILYLGGVRNVSKMCQKCVFFTPPRGALIIRQIGWFCTPPGYLARASRILVYTPPPHPPPPGPPPGAPPKHPPRHPPKYRFWPPSETDSTPTKPHVCLNQTMKKSGVF